MLKPYTTDHIRKFHSDGVVSQSLLGSYQVQGDIIKDYTQMSKLALDALYKMTGHLKFSVIMMDPPWKDTGVKKLGYPTMGYKDWMKIIDFDSL